MKKPNNPCFYDHRFSLPKECKEIKERDRCAEHRNKKWENCRRGGKSPRYEYYKTLTTCPWCGGELEVE